MNELDKNIEMQLKTIGELFAEKQDQYAISDDPLLNFRVGAKLTHHVDTYEAMFQSLKGYMEKHVAFVYTHNISAPKMSESLGDIIVYCLIARYMINKEAERHG